ncbi:MAG: VTT domain-containing protein [Desulfohalobiaceae bacterium]|nr:VTT domain-containing protein [Desulfohalobiaceae bacterium]
MISKKTKRLILLFCLVLAIGLFFALGLHQQFTLENIKAQQSWLESLTTNHPLAVIGVYLVVYIPVVALSLPGATVLGLAAGALFGALTGTVIVSFASSIGASLACVIARYILRDWVRARFGDRLRRVDEGIRSEGAFYLFSLRLIPLFPFFVINLVMGLTSMRLWTFYWVSQLGMLPGTFVYVNAGSQLAQIDSPGSIFSPSLILSFALLGIFPLAAKKALDIYRKRRTGHHSGQELKDGTGQELRQSLAQIAENCTLCGACRKQCSFLQKYGLPGEMAAAIQEKGSAKAIETARAFECSLCGLCSEQCPEGLRVQDMFLAMRREEAMSGALDEKRYAAILGYERRGNSRAFTWYGLPQGCDTVFFPGCSLPGSRSEATFRLYEHLAQTIPNLGVVLDCCNKPSHDLGRQNHFQTMFCEMREWLLGQGVKRILVACPNCFKIFQEYGQAFQVSSVWEVIDGNDRLPAPETTSGEITIHDPCPLRLEDSQHAAVRSIVAQYGLEIHEMRHKARKTLCCGEGGAVGFVNPQLAQEWAERRTEEADGRQILTYCAGCAGFLNRKAHVHHLADLLLWPEKTLNGAVKTARAPFTYLHRLALKRRFQKTVPAVRSRERPSPAQQQVEACTRNECLSSIIRRSITLSAVLILCAALFFVFQYRMHLLDSHVYTAQFHLMLIQSNMASGNTQLLADYFAALGPLGGLPHIIGTYVVQNILAPFGSPVAFLSLHQAFGRVGGTILSLTGMFGSGLFVFGLGRLLFGQVLPLLRRTWAPLSRALLPVLGILLAVPFIPLALPVLAGAVTRIRPPAMLLTLIAALLVRVMVLSIATTL